MGASSNKTKDRKEIDSYFLNVSKSGFLLKFIIGIYDKRNFYCLISSEKTINKKMIEKKEIIDIYDNEF